MRPYIFQVRCCNMANHREKKQARVIWAARNVAGSSLNSAHSSNHLLQYQRITSLKQNLESTDFILFLVTHTLFTPCCYIGTLPRRIIENNKQELSGQQETWPGHRSTVHILAIISCNINELLHSSKISNLRIFSYFW